MEHTKHIWRATLLIVMLAVAMIVARHFLIPETFGQAGHYRYGSLAEHMQHPVRHGGATACKECHDEEFEVVTGGKHASVQCEVCHAPVSRHIANQEKIADMPIDRSRRLCAYCHRKLRARPKDMPQVSFLEHLVETKALKPGAEIPDGVCLQCHEAHNPTGE